MMILPALALTVRRVRNLGLALPGTYTENFPAPFYLVSHHPASCRHTINIAADLGAMADSTKLPVGAWSPLYVVVYALGSVTAQVFLGYKRYVGVLKWPTLVLFAYVIALAVVHVPWGEAMRGLLIPKVDLMERSLRP